MEGDSFVNESQRLNTRDRVAKLKEDLKKRKAMLRGEIASDVVEDEGESKLNESIQIDTTQQELQMG